MPTTQITLAIRDNKGKIGRYQSFVETPATFAELQIIVDNTITTIDNVINGAIVSCNVTHTYPVQPSIPASISDVEDGLFTSLRTVDGYYTSLRVPTFDDTLYIAGTDEPNTEFEASVEALHDLFTQGYETPTAYKFTDRRGSLVAVVANWYRQFIPR